MQLAHFNMTAPAQKQSEDELRVSFNGWLKEVHDVVTGKTPVHNFMALKPERSSGTHNKPAASSIADSSDSLTNQVSTMRWSTAA